MNFVSIEVAFGTASRPSDSVAIYARRTLTPAHAFACLFLLSPDSMLFVNVNTI